MHPSKQTTPGNQFTKPQARVAAGSGRKPGSALLGMNPGGAVPGYSDGGYIQPDALSAPPTADQSASAPANRPVDGSLLHGGDFKMPIAYRNGGKIQGPGTTTSDSVAGELKQTGEPIALSNGERIVSAAQEQTLQKIAKARGFQSVDAMFEADTGKPVGPTVKGGKMGAETGLSPRRGYLTSSPEPVDTTPRRGYLSAGAPAPKPDSGASLAPGLGAATSTGTLPDRPVSLTPDDSGPKRGPSFSNDAKVSPGAVSDSSTSPTTYVGGQAMNVPGTVTQSDLIRSDKAISAVMGDRTGGNANANVSRNVQNLVGNAGERNVYNDAQKLKGSNVRAVSDGKGGLLLTGAMGNDVATKSPYVGADGAPTTDYTKTSQYAQGVASAADAKRMGNEMERSRLQLEAGSALKGYSIPAKAQLEQLDKAQAAEQSANVNAANIANTKANTTGSLLKNSEGAQLAALRKQLMEEQDPEKRAVLEEQMRAFGGRQQTAQFAHTSGGQTIDPTTGQVRTEPGQIYNVMTGQVSGGSGQQATPKYEVGKVMVDAKGNRAKWDGKKFIPA